jgi:hypothetical protein
VNMGKITALLQYLFFILDLIAYQRWIALQLALSSTKDFSEKTQSQPWLQHRQIVQVEIVLFFYFVSFVLVGRLSP